VLPKRQKHQPWRQRAGQRFTLKKLGFGTIQVGTATAYVHALLGPISVAMLGTIVMSYVKDKGVLDSLCTHPPPARPHPHPHPQPT
jgi:hypothetical protein